MLGEKFKTGNTAVIGFSTDDEDLNAYLDTFGNRIVITEIEEEDGEPTGNFWGVNLTHKVHCPYHLEARDITNIDETNYNVEDFANFKTFKDWSELAKGDTIVIKTVDQYDEDGDEITELVEKYAGCFLKVLAISEDRNEFGERTVTAQSQEGDIVTFTETEIDSIIG